MPSGKHRPGGPLPANAGAAVAVLAILLGGLIVFAPGVRGNAGYLLVKRHPLSFVADALAPNRSLKSAAFTLHPHQRACMSLVTFTPTSAIALFPLSPSRLGPTHPALDLVLSAPNYRFVASVAAGEYSRRVQFQVHPPERSVIGSACLSDRGPTPVSLEGTTEPRYTSRSTLTIDDKPVAGNVALTLLEKRRATQLESIGETFEHISNLTDHLLPVWLIEALIVGALISVPVGTVAAFHRALREDETVRQK